MESIMIMNQKNIVFKVQTQENIDEKATIFFQAFNHIS